jgi:hypothetical protein
LEIALSNRRLAVVTSLIALVMGALGVSMIYKFMDPEAASSLTGIFDFCIAGDASGCYSFAGFHMADDCGMASAAPEICANDSTYGQFSFQLYGQACNRTSNRAFRST